MISIRQACPRWTSSATGIGGSKTSAGGAKIQYVEDVETERLFLRRWHAGDLEPLASIFAKPEVWWFPFRRGWTNDETAAFLDRRLHEWLPDAISEWAAVEKGSGALIGYVGLSRPNFLPEVMPTVEVGWRLDPSYWGRGLATEGGRAALDYGFRVLKLDEIVSIFEPDNVASGQVMVRLGMTYLRDVVHPSRGLRLRVLRIVKDDWEVHLS